MASKKFPVSHGYNKSIRLGVKGCDDTWNYTSTTWSITDDSNFSGISINGSAVNGVSISTNSSTGVLTCTNNSTSTDEKYIIVEGTSLGGCTKDCEFTIEGKAVEPVETGIWYKYQGSAVEVTSISRSYSSLTIKPNDTMGNPIICQVNGTNITSTSEYSFSQLSGPTNVDLSFSTTSVGYPSQTYISVTIVPDNTAMSYFYNTMSNNTTATITGNITCKGYSLPYTISITKTNTDYSCRITVNIQNIMASYVQINSVQVGFSRDGQSYATTVGSATNVTSSLNYYDTSSTKYSYAYCTVEFKFIKYYGNDISLNLNCSYPTSSQVSITDKFYSNEQLNNTRTLTLFINYISGTQSATDFNIYIQ